MDNNRTAVSTFNLRKSKEIVYKMNTGAPTLTNVTLEIVTTGGVKTEFVFEVLICGLEKVTRNQEKLAEMARNMTFLSQKYNHLDRVGFKSIDQEIFDQWFTVANHSRCGVTNYVLCSDRNCKDYLLDGYSRTRNVWLETINATSGLLQPFKSPDYKGISPQGFGHFDLNLVQASSELRKTIKFKTDTIYDEKVYLGAVTRGYVFGTQELDISVTCGAEKVSSDYTDKYF